MLPPDQTTRAPILDSVERAANDLLAAAGDDAPPSIVAGLAVQRFEELARYLAQLIGEMGVGALFARSVAAARSTYPWLAVTTSSGPPWVALRGALERQAPPAIRDAFAGLLSTFIELLARLIGDGLVAHLVNDVWPQVSVQVPKEST